MTTRRGLEFTGFVAWDVDEIYSSDVLDGDLDGERLEIPFGAIRSIERFSSSSALVALHSGNDIDSGNRGIVTEDGGNEVRIRWSDFAEMQISRCRPVRPISKLRSAQGPGGVLS